MPMRDGGRLLSQHEWIFHFNKQAHDVVKTVKCAYSGELTGYGLKNKAGDKGSTAISVVRTHRVLGSVVAASPQKGGAHNHPAVMSVGLPIQLIQCWPGTVYEPFLGSGTTLIASEQLGRICYGMEISPQYVDVSVKRWEMFTGKTAYKLEAQT